MAGESNVGIKKRIMIMFWLFAFCMSLVVGRLAYFQLIKGDVYKQKAIEQQTRDQSVAARRGSIYDRNMKVLAQSASCEDVMINPRQIQSEAEAQATRRARAQLEGEPFNEVDVIDNVVTNLTTILGVDEEFVRNEIAMDKASRTIKKKVDPSVANQIRALDLPGVFFVESTKRYYPYSSFASHIIGFTGEDGGLEGLEKMLDDILAGTPGRIQVVQDVHNNATPYEYENYIAPEDGRGVVLTIDEVIQHYVEKYLQEAYNLYDIRNGATAIVMNPNTGEILAMAVTPSFDINSPTYVDEELKREILGEAKEDGTPYTDTDYYNKLWRNKAVVDTYEPGSTFKSIVAAAAIECGVLDPNTAAFDCAGVKIVGPHKIHCHKRAGHGAETFYQALENSCNPAFMEIGDAMGERRFREYYEAFGFTDTTDFVLPGESKGIFFSESNFNEVELATSSFGQGFQITPLQMITAFSAVVNGGNLMKPQLVKAYTDADGNIVSTVEPEIVREVISESTSRIMRNALEGVVANGTGNAAYVDGYRIGGKTGTSEKQPRGQGKYVASFIGFAPADDPQLVCLLILDEPGGGQTGGGAIAAPAVGKILSDSLSYLGYEPEYKETEEQVKVNVPSVVGMTTWEAEELCKENGLNVSIQGGGTTVTNQLPKANTRLGKNGLVILYTEATEEVQVEIPNFMGMDITEVQTLASQLKLNLTAMGGGASNEITAEMVAVNQGTPPGTMVAEGSVIVVEFAISTDDYIFNDEETQ